MAESDKEPVGNCPDHGPVYGDDLNFNSPEPATCEKDGCGKEVEQVVMANVGATGITYNGP